MESLAIHSHRPASQAEQTIIEPVAAFGFYILPDTIQNSCSDKATNSLIPAELFSASAVTEVCAKAITCILAKERVGSEERLTTITSVTPQV